LLHHFIDIVVKIPFVGFKCLQNRGMSMEIGEFNQEIEALVERAQDSDMSDEQITRLIAQQITAIAGENKTNSSGEEFKKWKSTQESTLAIKSLL